MLAAVALAGYALAGSLPGLVAARLVHGVGGGTAMPALFAAAGDAGHAGGRAVAMGRLGATIGLAAVVAPGSAGAAAAAVGTTPVFLAVAGVLGVAALLALGLPGRAASASVAGGEQATASTAGGRRAAMTAVFGFTVALGTLTGFLPDALAAREAGDATTGLLLTTFSLVAVGVMLSPAMRRIDPAAPGAALTAGVAAIAAALATLAVPLGVAGAVAAVVTIGVGFGAVFPAAAAVMAAAPDARRGRAFGRFHVAYGLGFVAGPPGAGAVGQAAQISPFVPAAVVAGACAAAAWQAARRG